VTKHESIQRTTGRCVYKTYPPQWQKELSNLLQGSCGKYVWIRKTPFEDNIWWHKWRV